MILRHDLDRQRWWAPRNHCSPRWAYSLEGIEHFPHCPIQWRNKSSPLGPQNSSFSPALGVSSYIWSTTFLRGDITLSFEAVSVLRAPFCLPGVTVLGSTQPGLYQNWLLYHHPPSSLLKTHSQETTGLSWVFRKKLHWTRILFSSLEVAFAIAVIAVLLFWPNSHPHIFAPRVLRANGKVYFQHEPYYFKLSFDHLRLLIAHETSIYYTCFDLFKHNTV